MLHITDAEYLDDYRVRVVFNNGREGVADLRPMILDKPATVFTPLKDLAMFRQFSIEHGTLSWPGELDVAPEYIYYLAFRDDESLHELFQEWGYLPSPVAV